MPIIEGLDNTGKNTLAARIMAQSDSKVKLHEFPDRTGLYGKEICQFLAGEVEYGPDVEKWFLENRLDYYGRNGGRDGSRNGGPKNISPGDIIIRSGISYLVYKWYRTGVEPTEEELTQEALLIGNEEIIYLDTVFTCPDSKSEIYDHPNEERQRVLDAMFRQIIASLATRSVSW